MRNIIALFSVLAALGILFQNRPVTALHNAVNRFEDPAGLLNTGDVVLRSGKGFISEMFRKTSQTERTYSHAGIVVIENDNYFVYHMLQTSGSGGLIKEPLASFCNSSTNTGYAVYRYQQASGKSQKLKSYLNQLALNKPRFDEHFSLKSANEIYCTELIYRIANDLYKIELPGSMLNDEKYIGLDNLYINSHSLKIIELTY